MTPEEDAAWQATRDEAYRDLDRATQALKDAAVTYATHPNTVTRYALHRAAEDYADAYLRGGKA